MRAGLYARVSREEQAKGHSIETQLVSMRHHAQRQGWTQERGWEIVEYIEPGFTARTDKRPIFQVLLRDAEAGRLDVVMVDELDRCFRDLEDQLRDLRRLRELDIAFVSVKERFDDTSSHGKFTQNFKGAINQYYSDLMSEKIQGGKQTRATKGLSNSRTAPFGYRRTRSGRDVPDPAAVKGVVMAFEAYANGGYSDTGVAELLNAGGFKPSAATRTGHWTVSSARHLLMNRVYIGEVRHKKDWYPGRHKPIVSRELFDKAQAVRAERATNPSGGPKGRIYLLHRVARCWHCGRFLHMSPKYKASRELAPSYREPGKILLTDCPATGRHVKQEVVDDQVARLVTRLELPGDWRDRLAELSASRAEREDVEGRRKYLQGRLRRLRELYVDGDFDKAEYDRRRADLQGQIDGLRSPDTPEIEQAGEVLESLGAEWANAPKQYKRDMLRCIFEGVYIDMLTKRLVCVKPWPQFAPLFRMDGLEEREDGCFYCGEEGNEEAGSED